MDRGIVVYSGWSGVEKTARGHLNVGVGGRAKACGQWHGEGCLAQKRQMPGWGVVSGVAWRHVV